MILVRDDPPFAALLPHLTVLPGDDGVVLLSTPRPKGKGATLDLGVSWAVEPVNMEVKAEAACLDVARALEGLLLALPEGAALQVLMAIRPAAPDVAEGWLRLREGRDDPALRFQREALARGFLHQDGALGIGRLRDVATRVTLRLPVPGIAPDLPLRVAAIVDGAAARLTARLTQQLGAHREALERARQAVEGILRGAGLKVTRQDGAALFRDLALFVHPGALQPLPAFRPDLPLRDQVLGVPAVLHHDDGAWRIGDLAVRVLSLREAPLQTFPGLLSADRAPGAARPLALWEVWPEWPAVVAVNIAVPNREAELTRIRQKRALAFFQRRGATGDESPETAALKRELDQVLTQAFAEGRRLLWARIHVALWGPPAALPGGEDAVIQAGRRLGLEFLPEPVLGPTFFLQTLPLGFDPAFPEERFLRRARRLLSHTLAQLLPLYGGFRGTPTPAQLYLNRRGEAVPFDLFDSPTAPHAVVVGTTGSGKSFLVNHLTLQVLPLGAFVVILDKWASYDNLCRLVGGLYVQVDYDRPVTLNPFHGPLDRAHRAFLLALLSEMASGGEGGDALSKDERAILSDALAAFAERGTTGREPLLSEFIALLREPPFNEEDGGGRRLARRLSPFYGRGPYAGFFDGPNAFTLDRSLTVVELSRLQEAPDLQAALLLALMHLLTTFVADPARRGLRKYLIIDEAWSLLKHETSARFLEEAGRTFRKFQTSAIFLTQQLSDFDSPAGKAVKDNAGTAVLLQQNPEEVEVMRRLFDLSDREVELLKSVRKRPRWSEAYLRLPDGAGGVIRLIPDPYLRWLATQQPHERAARERALDAAGGDLARAVAALAARYPDGLPE